MSDVAAIGRARATERENIERDSIAKAQLLELRYIADAVEGLRRDVASLMKRRQNEEAPT